MRIIALIQVYNERRFIANCIEHLREQGVEVYLVDNESTDDTVAIAERYVGRGVIDIESIAREDCYAVREQVAHKEQLAQRLDADWFIHYDADEVRVSPKQGQTLAEAIAEYDEAGFNAINFLEFTFVPTRESPDHDHPDFAKTMLWYYPYLPTFPHRLNAWKNQDGPVDLGGAGHRIKFPGLRMAPESLYMRHYMFLSAEHVREKYVGMPRREPPGLPQHWRGLLRADDVQLSSEKEMRRYTADHLLDPSEPRTTHLIAQFAPPPEPQPQPQQRGSANPLRRVGRRVKRFAAGS
ncbi:MAG TPA: glycosyltransferase family 2 protein [Solirubrobacteraceae bacterium]|nr:glycosyltransferase family 2 protein [Solirubrobacteraceae bacterium]